MAAQPSGKWIKEEDEALRLAVLACGGKNWKAIAARLGGEGGGRHTDTQCLHRWNKVLKPGLVKGPWTKSEDTVVRETVILHGVGNIKVKSRSWRRSAFCIPSVPAPLWPFCHPESFLLPPALCLHFCASTLY